MLPARGGSATAFKDLARALPARFDVMSVQYPGRQDRYHEPPFTALAALVEAVAGELTRELAAAPGGPYALFGHSMGALVAFETARLLASRGELPSPQRLFLSGRGGPGTSSLPTTSTTTPMCWTTCAGWAAPTRPCSRTPTSWSWCCRALRADYRALGTYRWRAGEPLTCAVTALTGDRDPMMKPEDAGTWRAHTTGDFTVKVFPGGHFYLYDQTDRIASAVTEGMLTAAAAA